MMKTGKMMGLAVMAGAIGLLGTGCATNRGIVNMQVAMPANPDKGKVVRIAKVTDQRKFELRPESASIPSLKDGEINDESVTSRAIARKRNGYGKALGDILLPEGRTVTDVVSEALTRAFREAGYRVAEDADAKATPITADIQQFWAWVTPGFWAMGMEFETIVEIKGNIPPFKDSQSVRGYVNLHTQAAGTRAWQNTLDKGLDEFVKEVVKSLEGGK